MTKAIVAKGKKRTNSKETLCPPNKPTSILGCWVINHTHQAKKSGKYVEVSGRFDINVWYSHSKHSKTSVYTETIAYKDRIRLHYRDEPTSRHEEVIVNVIQHPNCTEAIISDCGEKFIISVERELIAEVIGETKVCITVHPHSFEEEWSIQDESSSSSSRGRSDHRGHHDDKQDRSNENKNQHHHQHSQGPSLGQRKGRESTSF